MDECSLKTAENLTQVEVVGALEEIEEEEVVVLRA
jgi:hypothetical protein